MAYDPEGEHPRARVTTSTYDAEGRLLSSHSAEHSIPYSYQETAYRLGAPLPAQVVTVCYDALGRRDFPRGLPPRA
ncbi:MAG TPA: hypothetical protein VKD72_30595 [Gemmataceae bacterium]|nr:hypothetical protein [Gemmataceae bacterium]